MRSLVYLLLLFINLISAAGCGSLWEPWLSPGLPITFQQIEPRPTSLRLNKVWGFDARNVWAVGDGGTILKWDGSGWQAQSSGVTNNLYAIWGLDPNHVFCVGDDSTILYWDGLKWTKQEGQVIANFRGVWGTSTSDIWAVG